MRPLKLVMSGFGPYAEKEVIDMSKLGESGLYLITGDTGAGKTTIFDAISFALFGEPSGANREANMLRSTSAAPTTRTEVELTFELNGKEYYVKRNPEFTRKSARGEGFTKESANAEYKDSDGVIITGKTKVNKAIESLLGVNKDQFAQIAMIAQGDFMKLLYAETSQRQKIFTELFHTGRFGILQDKLKAEQASINASYQDASKSMEQYILGILCDEESPNISQLERAKNSELMTEEVIDLLDKLIAEDSLKYSEYQKELEQIDRTLEQINNQLGRAEQIEAAKKNLVSASEEYKENLPKLEVANKELLTAKENLTAKDVYQAEVTKLKASLPQYTKLDEMDKQIAENNNKLEAGNKKLGSFEKALEDLKVKSGELKKEHEQLKDAGENKVKLLAELDKIQDALNRLSSLKEENDNLCNKEKKLLEIQSVYKKNNDTFVEIRNNYEHLDQAYRDGQAGILASTLVSGCPCPVCGSTAHPHLAVLSEDVPDKKELDELKKKVESARNKAENSSKEAERIGGEVNQLKKAVLQKADILLGDKYDDLQSDLTKAICDNRDKYEKFKDEISKEDKKVARRDEIQTLIVNVDNSIAESIESIAKQKEANAAFIAFIESTKKQRDELSKELIYDSSKIVNEKITELEGKSNMLTKAYEAAESAHTALTERIKHLEGSIESLKKTIEGSDAYDLEALIESKNKSVERKQNNTAIQKELYARVNNNKDIKTNILSKKDEIADLEKKYSFISTLSDTANGKITGKGKFMLETYVQTTYFDRILRRANLRLNRMSDGQYDLERVSTVENNRSQMGLEIRVIDHNNGTTRSVKSLSGGEAFMASLSLALGLSDEIQDSTSGIRIDTMFVDEGFGSLDTEKTLPMAYNALVSITEGNKLVGIISHVAELKDKIDKQIIVTKDKFGVSKVELKA